MGMNIGRMVLVMAVTGSFLIAISVYSCGNSRPGNGSESLWETQTTPAVTFHSKVAVMHRERTLRPVIRRDVLWLTENIKTVFRDFGNV